MTILRGFSELADTGDAVREFADSVDQPNPALVVFFCSPSMDREVVRDVLTRRFPDCSVVGCTTAGEITPNGYRDGSITGVSFSADHFHVVTRLVPRLNDFSIEDVRAAGEYAVEGLKGELGDRFDPHRSFAMLLVDGLSRQEEALVSTLDSVLGAIPLFGGSAGDGLEFRDTYVFYDGRFVQDAAVLTLIQTDCGFEVFKFDHFQATDRKMVVTEADPDRRIVTEINAEPAAVEYARLVGLDETQLSPMIFASHPVVVRVGGDYHVRSIQQVEDDGSLRFYCAIDEGLVLTVADCNDMVSHLEATLDGLSRHIGQSQVIVGFDCILRRLEAERNQQTISVSDILSKYKVVGFNTYGEQYRSMHVNQTFTGVIIACPRSA